MAVSGSAVAYCVVGGVVLYSGIKGSSLSDTVKAVLAGNLNVTDTQTVPFDASSSSPGAPGSPTTAAAGSLSQNGVTIYKYLRSNGYSPIQAAGATCSAWGESSWDPEQWHLDTNGLYSGGVWQFNGPNYPNFTGQAKPTGNATADLDAQLQGIIKYVSANGYQQYVNMMNGTKSISTASQIWSQYVERAGVSDVHATGAQDTLNIVNQVDPGSGLTV
jgi:hypothetical protein